MNIITLNNSQYKESNNTSFIDMNSSKNLNEMKIRFSIYFFFVLLTCLTLLNILMSIKFRSLKKEIVKLTYVSIFVWLVSLGYIFFYEYFFYCYGNWFIILKYIINVVLYFIVVAIVAFSCYFLYEVIRLRKNSVNSQNE